MTSPPKARPESPPPAGPSAYLRRLAGRVRKPALTIRTRLTLIYAGLFTLGGGVLVLAMTTAFYHLLFKPLPDSEIPSRLDPDHDHFVGLSDQIRDAAASHLLRIALVLLLVVVAVSALLGWWIAGRMLRPIAAITAAARRATGTTLHERLNLPGPPDELKELGDTFDRMLERLDAAFAAQRRFVANASHELRTPLALTRAAVEVTLAKPAVTEEQWRTMAQDVSQSTHHAQRLTDALLVLARSEQRMTEYEVDDLADLAAEALDQVAARRAERGLRLTADLPPAPVRGNVALLGIAVGNIVENAVKYNRDGGLLSVTTRRTEAGQAELVVRNDGPVLDEGTADELFEPFHRGRHTRSGRADGTGLGLSIVRAVTEAHGGRVTLRAPSTGGLVVTLCLPAPDAARPS
ncbi:HAMP domain-containing sensor histidine kinase [Streptantibioticus parmotrematis]|uniref:sensor histidine kinase n=1 Tax=Streptantibioticus parmotrematis TaxID=2873249 RepID=UPI0034069B63